VNALAFKLDNVQYNCKPPHENAETEMKYLRLSGLCKIHDQKQQKKYRKKYSKRKLNSQPTAESSCPLAAEPAIPQHSPASTRTPHGAGPYARRARQTRGPRLSSRPLPSPGPLAAHQPLVQLPLLRFWTAASWTAICTVLYAQELTVQERRGRLRRDLSVNL
jgi:hypothetical protein